MSDAGSDSPQPFELANSAAKQHAPATERNRDPIARVLQEILPQTGAVLEVASGTGEHAVHFARMFPHLKWQPTDYSDAAIASIAAWRAEASLPNLLPPLRLDLMGGAWPTSAADAIFCANMTHIAPWEATCGLFDGAGRVLTDQGMLVVYGPFVETDVETAPSNLAFERSLRQRDASWGLRDLDAVDRLARKAGMVRTQRIEMPANNLMLIYSRRT
ncbi:DUF938 domain-containing protein [Croceicoccus naphthovorans]|uniref:SAM-dependent methyltransferase n=1 Tax=Croceicoccus naphthovorans TaxID=1348774 RepID=A0A0G3XHS6_9SPHN|nr:DUF938 domain-containing protein [Croceicoccus naphthovorans]AKM10166.1 SAM-dependent methyltransferase [Croceicoccus naphthovorans]MBB3990603.1 hypothetical protein [Croceicoccus naphthovorans]